MRMAALTQSKRLTECEIYLNKAAVKDIVAWIKARSAMDEGGCPACLALEPRIKNEENPPSTVELPLFASRSTTPSRHMI